MLNVVHMTANGREVESTVDPREFLLETLRNHLGLTGMKKSCEVGECGACAVLVDGKATDNCIYLTIWAEGRSIMTVEGLKGPNGELSAIQKVFVEEATVRYGFCASGLTMTAVETVGTGKWYNRDELRKLISSHLCRCTGYENILNAVECIVEETYEVMGKQKRYASAVKAAALRKLRLTPGYIGFQDKERRTIIRKEGAAEWKRSLLSLTTYFQYRWVLILRRQIKITNIINQLKKYVFQVKYRETLFVLSWIYDWPYNDIYVNIRIGLDG